MTSVATTPETPVLPALEAEPMPEEQSQFQLVVRRFRRHKLAMVALGLVLAILAVSLFAPLIAPVKPTDIDINTTIAPPFTRGEASGIMHWLGTDHLGRDYLSRIIYAARISLTVAVSCTLLSTTFGMILGAVAGYYGGWVDALLMRFVEFMLTIPTLPLLLIISAILLQFPDLLPVPQIVIQVMSKILLIPENQARQAVLIIIVLVAFGWMGVAQLMRGMVLSLRDQYFVEAARAMGATDLHIILRHMIPNSMAPIIVSASLALGGYIIAEASLSFLGLGIQDPTPTWGNMLSAAQSYMFQHPWMPLIPGTPIFLCALSFNFVGDGLRDALDPRLKL
jgi:peptide/nickel transport system permease protein